MTLEYDFSPKDMARCLHGVFIEEFNDSYSTWYKVASLGSKIKPSRIVSFSDEEFAKFAKRVVPSCIVSFPDEEFAKRVVSHLEGSYGYRCRLECSSDDRMGTYGSICILNEWE